MAVTQKEIATFLGISPQAVNFALGHRNKQVSLETRQRVIEAARRLGYRTNAAARAVSTGSFNAIGMLMSQHHCQSTLFAQTLRGIYEGIEARGMHLTVTIIDDNRLTSGQHLPKILGETMVDGLLLNYTHDIPPQMVELIDRHQIPAVWLNSKRPENGVYPDDEAAGYAATRSLLAAGHRRISYLDLTAVLEKAHEWHYSRHDRRAGYARAMLEAGHEPLAFISPGPLLHMKIVEQATRLLQDASAPTAVVAYGSEEASAVVQACARLGLEVGQDVSLVTFGEDQPLVGPKIETYRSPQRRLGRAAADMLLARLDCGGQTMPSEALSFGVVPGLSVRRLSDADASRMQ